MKKFIAISRNKSIMGTDGTVGTHGGVITTDVNSIVSKSGLSVSDNGRMILITQGLTGYTLVGGKKLLIRLFYSNPSEISQVTSIVATVLFRARQSNYLLKITFLIPAGDLIIENSPPNGPSVGILLAGRVFENLSYLHAMEFRVMAGSTIISTDTTPYMNFLPAGTLRIVTKTIETITRNAPWGFKITPNFTWLFDLHEAMVRLEAMLPVRDGLYIGSNPGHEGLAYVIGETTDAWPPICPDGNPPSEPEPEYPNFLRCPGEVMAKANSQEAIRLNSMGTRIDITVVWRPRDPRKIPPAYGGEDCGGKARSNFRLASVVGGKWHDVENTAPVMAQEIAHLFGAVSGSSPHTDGGGHSKDPEIYDSFAFDFVLQRPYYPISQGFYGHFIGDVMSYAWKQGKDLTLFSAYDWEHLRERLSKFSVISAAIVDETEQKSQKKMAEDLQNTFTDLHKIEIVNPESTLSSKPGLEWYWTHLGFQLLSEKEQSNQGSISNVEMIFSSLKKLGITEFYAPIDGKPMPIIITPDKNKNINCQIED